MSAVREVGVDHLHAAGQPFGFVYTRDSFSRFEAHLKQSIHASVLKGSGPKSDKNTSETNRPTFWPRLPHSAAPKNTGLPMHDSSQKMVGQLRGYGIDYAFSDWQMVGVVIVGTGAPFTVIPTPYTMADVKKVANAGLLEKRDINCCP